MKRTVAVITEKGRVSTSAFISHEHALRNLDPFHLCIVRSAVADYFKLHPFFVARDDKQALQEIGNIAGAPDTHYAVPMTRLFEAQQKLEKIARIVIEQLAGTLPVKDADDLRQGLSVRQVLDKAGICGYYYRTGAE